MTIPAYDLRLYFDEDCYPYRWRARRRGYRRVIRFRVTRRGDVRRWGHRYARHARRRR